MTARAATAALALAGLLASTASFSQLAPKPFPGSGVYAAMSPYNVSCNATDETSGLQAAERTAQLSGRELVLPAGRCGHKGLLVTGALHVRGQGKGVTRLFSLIGSTAPSITVAVPSTVPTFNANEVGVTFQDLSIDGQTRADVAGQGVAHGLSLAVPAGDSAGGAYVRVDLDNVSIDGVPGDGIHAVGWKGVLEAHNSEVIYPGGYGVSAVSVTDWRWIGGEIMGAVLCNVGLSGTSAMVFTDVNVYVAQQCDYKIYDAYDTRIIGGTVDLTGQDGILVDLRSPAQALLLSSTRVRWSNTSGGGFSDLRLASTNVGQVYMSLVPFDAPASSSSANKPAWNIYAQPGNTGLVHGTPIFAASGAPASVVSDPSKLVPN